MSRVEPPDLLPDAIARALGGDAAAFRLFYARYDPNVRWAVGLRLYRWPEMVPAFEDIVQEVWWALTRNGGKRLLYHDPARGVPFWRFLMLVATRLAWKIANRRLGPVEVELVEVPDESESFADRMQDAEFLERLIGMAKEQLDEKDWALFEGYYVRGELLKDVGARLGMNENATYKRKERLQKKLLAMAEELLGEVPTKIPPDLVAVLLVLFVTAGLSEPRLGDAEGSARSLDGLAAEVEHE